MFEFLADIDNYEDRKVDHTKYEWGFVSTVRCSDGSQPYETAIQSAEYAPPDDLDNRGNMIIIEGYDSFGEAQIGHMKWCDVIQNQSPDELVDCCNSGVSGVLKAMGEDIREVRVKKEQQT